ncbi:MAG TPA: hypothetical protein VMW95_01060 [Desulfobacterales bacterium]|nr:hypothetical protein [Desulfobacterales bacterium]
MLDEKYQLRQKLTLSSGEPDNAGVAIFHHRDLELHRRPSHTPCPPRGPVCHRPRMVFSPFKAITAKTNTAIKMEAAKIEFRVI